MNQIEYIVGKNARLNICLAPFDDKIILFLEELSKMINLLNIKSFVDVKAFSFFCRKKNILNLKLKYAKNDTIRVGLGTLFHITPSNIPTNFAYSLVFGLISGNSNIIKVPSKNFEEINLICKSLKNVLKKKEFSKIRQMITIVKYSQSDLWTKKFSLIADGRLIWGGDKTIMEIKKFETKAKTIDVPFSDRYSISIINSEKFLKLKEYDKLNLIRNFYNDTYAVDQNACSSPHIILWKGKLLNQAKKKFWRDLDNYVRKKYNPPLISIIDNFHRMTSDLMENTNIQYFKKYNKSQYVITLKDLKKNEYIKKTKWGFFYEYQIKNLNELKFITERKLQTITYFGFTKKYLRDFFKKNHFKGIDRIVPFGQGLNINLVWDGYDLNKILSREIEII